MKKRGSLVVSPLIALCAVLPPVTAWAQAELTVQLLPGGDHEQLVNTLELLADVAEQEAYVARRDMTLAEVVRDRCGTATQELIELFRKASPKLRKGLQQGEMAPVPACPSWHFDKEVTVRENATAWDIAVRYLGSGGPRAMGQLERANNGVDLSKLEPSQVLKIPYVSLPVSVRLKKELAHRAAEIEDRFAELRSNGVGGRRVLYVEVSDALETIRKLAPEEPSEELPPEPDPDSAYEPDFEPMGPEEAPAEFQAIRAEGTLELWAKVPDQPVSSQTDEARMMGAAEPAEPDRAPAGPTTSQPELHPAPRPQPLPPAPRGATAEPSAAPGLCPEALAREDWPFDAEQLLETLRHNRDRGAALAATEPIIVAVVDTGIEQEESGIRDLPEGHRLDPPQRPRFSFAISAPELTGVRFADDDDNFCEDDIIGTNLDNKRDFPRADREYAQGDHGIHVAGLVLGGFKSETLRELAMEKIQLKILNVVKKTVKRDLEAETLRPSWSIPKSALTAGLLYADAAFARIANYSLTEGGTLDATFQTNFNSARNLLLVVAAGNDSKNLDAEPRYPAALGGRQAPRAITVAAHGPDDSLLPGSNTGSTYVDVAAPGCAIESSTFDGALKSYDGTSFAAPLVTFTAGLLFAEGITSPKRVKRRILVSTEADPKLEASIASAGRLDILKALSVHDDLVVLADRKRVIKGRIIQPASLKTCGKDTGIRDLNQVVFDYAEGRSVRVTHFNVLGHLSYSYCDERPDTVLEIRTRDGATERVPTAQIAEIVPAEFPGG